VQLYVLTVNNLWLDPFKTCSQDGSRDPQFLAPTKRREIRFSAEGFESALPQALTLDTVLGLLGRTSPQERSGVCARGIATEFAESDYIGKSIVCMLLVSMTVVSDEPRAQYFVLNSIIFVLCSAVLLFIFIPKVLGATKGSSTRTPNMTDSIIQSLQSTGSSQNSVDGSLRTVDQFKANGSEFLSNNGSSRSVQGIEILHGPQQYRQICVESTKLRVQIEELQRRWTESEDRIAELQALYPAENLPEHSSTEEVSELHSRQEITTTTGDCSASEAADSSCSCDCISAEPSKQGMDDMGDQKFHNSSTSATYAIVQDHTENGPSSDD